MLTLAITNYNRTDMLMRSFEKVMNDQRLDDIVIVDDFSTQENYDWVRKATEGMEKVRLIRNVKNYGMMRNKHHAVAQSKNEWLILFDSDNIIDPSYLDAIPKTLVPNTIYCPSFAEPNFDFRRLPLRFDRSNAKNYLSRKEFSWFINVCNWVCHRDSYLDVFEYSPVIKATDTAFFVYNWLKQGGIMQIVPSMHYQHTVHDESGFMKDVNYNMAKAEEIKKMISRL